MSVEENASQKALTSRKIHLLTEEVFNRIAAGEVVERPASVLKELIENSLDAGATSIEVTVAGAGRSEICVSDDGEGMTKADLLLAFERHATSKVATVNDLLAIRTLGFRGEALSAIASVSRIEAISRQGTELSGYKIRLQGGKIQDIVETGAPIGTTIAVRDLFFNTPARKKFLKSKAVENGHLLNVLRRFALAYPQVRWSYELDGKNVYRLPPESLDNRLLAVFSEELSGRIFPVEYDDSGMKITGFIGSVEIARRSRGDQHLYINRRWVQNRLLGHAIASSFGRLIEEGKFPFYVLFLDLPPEEVDVNVHPAKTEVKFRRESEMYNFVHRSIAQALQKAGVDAFPGINLESGEQVDQRTGEIRSFPSIPGGQSTTPPYPQGRGYAPAFGKRGIASPEAYQLVFGRSSDGESDAAFESAEDSSERTQVYQFHRRYIVTEIKSGIAIIDQHAAHERILYEKALKALNGNRLHGQQMLFPKILELDAENALRLREVLEDLTMLGISIREFGERSFVLEALPVSLGEVSDDRLVLDILDELRERGVTKNPGHEQIAAAFACRGAIKFGQSLSLAEMNALIDQLFATQFPFTCPHGRPTLLQLSLGELERRFGRA